MTDEPLQLYSVKDAARRLGISLASTWRLINTRKLPVVRINQRTLLSEEHLKKFVESRTYSKQTGIRVCHDIRFK